MGFWKKRGKEKPRVIQVISSRCFSTKAIQSPLRYDKKNSTPLRVPLIVEFSPAFFLWRQCRTRISGSEEKKWKTIFSWWVTGGAETRNPDAPTYVNRKLPTLLTTRACLSLYCVNIALLFFLSIFGTKWNDGAFSVSFLGEGDWLVSLVWKLLRVFCLVRRKKNNFWHVEVKKDWTCYGKSQTCNEIWNFHVRKACTGKTWTCRKKFWLWVYTWRSRT